MVKTYSFVRFSFLCRSKNPEKLMFFEVFKEAQTGFEPVDTGVADHCLTTWLLRLVYYIICRTQSKNDSDGNRTRVTAVKGRCLNRLTTEPLFFSRFLPLAPRFLQRSLTPQDSAFTATPRVGLEPTTTRLTAECSTIELSRITSYRFSLTTYMNPYPQNRTLNLIFSPKLTFPYLQDKPSTD